MHYRAYRYHTPGVYASGLRSQSSLSQVWVTYRGHQIGGGLRDDQRGRFSRAGVEGSSLSRPPPHTDTHAYRSKVSRRGAGSARTYIIRRIDSSDGVRRSLDGLCAGVHDGRHVAADELRGAVLVDQADAVYGDHPEVVGVQRHVGALPRVLDDGGVHLVGERQGEGSGNG